MKNYFLDEITEQISLPMALVDYIPVILFVCTCVILLLHFFRKMKLWNYIIMVVGCAGVSIAGLGKAIWKTLCVFGINIKWINDSFFPVQSMSFLILAIALLIYGAMISKDKKNNIETTYAMAPLTLVSILLQVVGFALLVVALIVITVKSCEKKVLPIVLFALSFVFMMGMGYLGVKFDDSSSMHWIAQVTNIIGQTSLFTGTLLIYVDAKKHNKLPQ